MRAAWGGVRLRRLDDPERRLAFGKSLKIEVAVQLSGLSPGDVTVEALFGRPSASNNFARRSRHYTLTAQHAVDHGEMLYTLDLTPELCGKLEYRIRIYPSHPALIHKFETGLTLWL